MYIDDCGYLHNFRFELGFWQLVCLSSAYRLNLLKVIYYFIKMDEESMWRGFYDKLQQQKSVEQQEHDSK